MGAALLAAALLAHCDGEENLRDFQIDTRIETLRDHHGQPFALQQVLDRNKTVLLYFGFTHCPDFCPATLSKLQKVYRILGARSRHLQTILITVDPARDTPARLKQYLEYFEIDALGLTGSAAEIAEVAERYGAHYEVHQLEAPGPNSSADDNYTVDHSTGLYLIDARGRVRHVFKHGDSPQLMAETLQMLLPFF
tara:strand:+ start:133 stop:717 length:585 start_codon:yes stop_codon:yes gene_type:complete